MVTTHTLKEGPWLSAESRVLPRTSTGEVPDVVYRLMDRRQLQEAQDSGSLEPAPGTDMIWASGEPVFYSQSDPTKPIVLVGIEYSDDDGWSASVSSTGDVYARTRRPVPISKVSVVSEGENFGELLQAWRQKVAQGLKETYEFPVYDASHETWEKVQNESGGGSLIRVIERPDEGWSEFMLSGIEDYPGDPNEIPFMVGHKIGKSSNFKLSYGRPGQTVEEVKKDFVQDLIAKGHYMPPRLSETPEWASDEADSFPPVPLTDIALEDTPGFYREKKYGKAVLDKELEGSPLARHLVKRAGIEDRLNLGADNFAPNIETVSKSEFLTDMWAPGEEALETVRRKAGKKVSEKQIQTARDVFARATQKSLDRRGVFDSGGWRGNKAYVFRGGDPKGSPETPTAVSLNPIWAAEFARASDGNLRMYEVERKDVLLDADAVIWGDKSRDPYTGAMQDGEWQHEEDELIVRIKDLKNPRTVVLPYTDQYRREGKSLEFIKGNPGRYVTGAGAPRADASPGGGLDQVEGNKGIKLLIEGEDYEPGQTEGQCYAMTVHAARKNQDLEPVIVHGRNPKLAPGGHAWLEFGDTVYDPTARVTNRFTGETQIGEVTTKENWYEKQGFIPDERYDYWDLMATLVKEGHYGPYGAPAQQSSSPGQRLDTAGRLELERRIIKAAALWWDFEEENNLGDKSPDIKDKNWEHWEIGQILNSLAETIEKHQPVEDSYPYDTPQWPADKTVQEIKDTLDEWEDLISDSLDTEPYKSTANLHGPKWHGKPHESSEEWESAGYDPDHAWQLGTTDYGNRDSLDKRVAALAAPDGERDLEAEMKARWDSSPAGGLDMVRQPIHEGGKPTQGNMDTTTANKEAWGWSCPPPPDKPTLDQMRALAECQAIHNLAINKYSNFGYHASKLINYNHLLPGLGRPKPGTNVFKPLVDEARRLKIARGAEHYEQLYQEGETHNQGSPDLSPAGGLDKVAKKGKSPGQIRREKHEKIARRLKLGTDGFLWADGDRYTKGTERYQIKQPNGTIETVDIEHVKVVSPRKTKFMRREYGPGVVPIDTALIDKKTGKKQTKPVKEYWTVSQSFMGGPGSKSDGLGGFGTGGFSTYYTKKERNKVEKDLEKLGFKQQKKNPQGGWSHLADASPSGGLDLVERKGGTDAVHQYAELYESFVEDHPEGGKFGHDFTTNRDDTRIREMRQLVADNPDKFGPQYDKAFRIKRGDSPLGRGIYTPGPDAENWLRDNASPSGGLDQVEPGNSPGGPIDLNPILAKYQDQIDSNMRSYLESTEPGTGGGFEGWRPTPETRELVQNFMNDFAKAVVETGAVNDKNSLSAATDAALQETFGDMDMTYHFGGRAWSVGSKSEGVEEIRKLLGLNVSGGHESVPVELGNLLTNAFAQTNLDFHGNPPNPFGSDLSPSGGLDKEKEGEAQAARIWEGIKKVEDDYRALFDEDDPDWDYDDPPAGGPDQAPPAGGPDQVEPGNKGSLFTREVEKKDQRITVVGGREGTVVDVYVAPDGVNKNMLVITDDGGGFLSIVGMTSEKEPFGKYYPDFEDALDRHNELRIAEGMGHQIGGSRAVRHQRRRAEGDPHISTGDQVEELIADAPPGSERSNHQRKLVDYYHAGRGMGKNRHQALLYASEQFTVEHPEIRSAVSYGAVAYLAAPSHPVDPMPADAPALFEPSTGRLRGHYPKTSSKPTPTKAKTPGKPTKSAWTNPSGKVKSYRDTKTGNKFARRASGRKPRGSRFVKA